MGVCSDRNSGSKRLPEIYFSALGSTVIDHTLSLLKEFISMTFDHPYFDSILNQNKNDQKVIEEDFLEK